MANEAVNIKLLADYFDGKPVYEAVPAIQIGKRRYKVVGSPGLAPGVASGDEIELAASERLGYRVVKRGGNVSIQVFLNRCTQDDRSRIVELFEPIGGWLDGFSDAGSGFILIITVPVTAGFDKIEAVMQQISQECFLDKWMYGNVYDIRDGVTPLNWWL